MFRYGHRVDPQIRLAHGADTLARRAMERSIERVFAFDRPGELAFLDDLSVLAADGLTTNIGFQRELIDHGIGWALDRFRIQAVVLPRLGGRYGEEMCGHTYLASLRFLCGGGDPKQISRIEAISRLNGASLGWLDLAGLPRLDVCPDEDLVVVLLEGGRAAPPLDASEFPR
jgi:hypothetical protein